MPGSIEQEREIERLACANYLGVKPELIDRVELTKDGGGHFTGLRVIIFIRTGRAVNEWIKEHLPAKQGPVDYGVLTPKQRDALLAKGKKLLRLRGDRYIDNTRQRPEEECYCWECGYIALEKEFLKENKCPNPDCPDPRMWDD